jgi:DNA adenine methylase
MTVRSPIRWVGGKYKLRYKIIELSPPQGTYTCYVELFGGAAWVLFAKQPSPVEVLNDKDGELVHFFRVLRESPDALAERVSRYPLVSRQEFDDLALLDPTKLTSLDRAYRFFYLVMAGWGGEVDMPRFQTSVTDGGKGNRMFGALQSLRQRLYPASIRLSQVLIENLDWPECLERYDNPKSFIYLDPPYPGNSCNYSHNMLGLREHRILAERLRKCKARWLLTLYDNDDIRELYKEFNLKPVQFASGMDGDDGRQNSELIITNYDPEAVAKEYKLIARRTKCHDIALEDKVEVTVGPYAGEKGVVDGFRNGRLSIRSKGGPITVAPSYVRVLRKQRSEKEVIDKRISNLRNEICSALDTPMLLQLEKLQQDGLVTDPVAAVKLFLQQGIERLNSD